MRSGAGMRVARAESASSHLRPVSSKGNEGQHRSYLRPSQLYAGGFHGPLRGQSYRGFRPKDLSGPGLKQREPGFDDVFCPLGFFNHLLEDLCRSGLKLLPDDRIPDGREVDADVVRCA